MKVKFILPVLKEASDSSFRALKYSMFPPIGLAVLAGFCPDDDVEIVDEHVEDLSIDDEPDLVCIQTYITNAYRAYKIADTYRSRGVYVAIGGIHATTLPDEAKAHADTVLTGPAENIFKEFMEDFRNKHPQPFYHAFDVDFSNAPLPRRELIKKEKYLMPNSLVFSRGCVNKCSFCYISSFYRGKKSFYTYKLDKVLEDIDRFDGKHVYFLDDNIFADKNFSADLFREIRGMKKLFQGAITVDSILKDELIELARDCGMRSAFIGFESLSENNLKSVDKRSNLTENYAHAIKRLDTLGIMINGSFIFGLDDDDKAVFKNTTDWAIDSGITTATFHILTPYPGTKLYDNMKRAGRIVSGDWNLYDTRNLIFNHPNITRDEMEEGYANAYKNFYTWKGIISAAKQHEKTKMKLKHFTYSGAWKKFNPVWDFLVNQNMLGNMRKMIDITMK